MDQQRQVHAITSACSRNDQLTAYLAQPRMAVEPSNDLIQSQPVGRLFHSTR